MFGGYPGGGSIKLMRESRAPGAGAYAGTQTAAAKNSVGGGFHRE